MDWKLREGYIKAWPQTLPIIPVRDHECSTPSVLLITNLQGWDVAGTVEAVGSDASDFKVGDQVYSYTRPAWDMKVDGETTDNESIGLNGTLAQYVSVAQWKVTHKPKSLDMNNAAAIPLAGLTAWQGLFDHGKVTAGQTVLVLGASGGVGSFAVQFAKVKGATVIGTCSGRNVDFVRSLGADHVVDYSQGDVAAAVRAIAPNGVDMVYDAVGGDSSAAGVASAKDGGIVISIANFGIADLCNERGLTGKAFLVAPSAPQLREIGDLIDAGKVRVGALEAFPLAEYRSVFEKSQSGRTRGKMVLIP